MSKKQSNQPDSSISMATDMLQTGLSGLDAYVTSTSDLVAKSRDPESAESFAHLLTKVAQVASELRKAEAAERKAAGETTEAEWLDWYRRLDPTRRARLDGELAQIRSKKSGLA